MLWIALVGATGFFLVTLLLAAAGLLTSSWYVIGAVVYGALFVIAIIGFLTESPATVVVERFVTREVAPVAAAPRARVEEKVLYSTPRGSVVEVTESNGSVVKDIEVETLGQRRPVADIEREIDASGWSADGDESPENEELRPALQRWGRVHGGS